LVFQFTLTVPEAKRVIAKAIASMPEVRKAMAGGKVFIKGGTTTSAVSEELGGPPLRISGRISPNGARGALRKDGAPHSLVFEKGVPRPADSTLEEVVDSLGPQDVAVLAANLLDRDGRAAMLAGSPLGGPPGRALSGLAAQGAQVLIACGLEKLFPGRIDDAVAACGRSKVDRAIGMGVGLIPLYGRVVSEVEACSILAGVKATVIARGGIAGAEGATTLVAEGSLEQVRVLEEAVRAVKGAVNSGDPGSLEECRAGAAGCGRHRACADLQDMAR